MVNELNNKELRQMGAAEIIEAIEAGIKAFATVAGVKHEVCNATSHWGNPIVWLKNSTLDYVEVWNLK